MEGVIFDLDGVLIDSMFIWDRLAQDYLKSLGLEAPQDLYKDLREMDLAQSSAYLSSQYDLGIPSREVEKGLKEILLAYYRDKLQLKPGVRELLDSLQARDLLLCIGTTTSQDLVLPLVERLDLGPYFKFIQTEDQIGIRKTQPEFYRRAQESLGSSPKKTWVVEDALYAIKSAKKAGFSVLGVGDRSNKDLVDQIKESSDIYIEDFNKLEVDRLWKNY